MTQARGIGASRGGSSRSRWCATGPAPGRRRGTSRRRDGGRTPRGPRRGALCVGVLSARTGRLAAGGPDAAAEAGRPLWPGDGERPKTRSLRSPSVQRWSVFGAARAFGLPVDPVTTGRLPTCIRVRVGGRCTHGVRRARCLGARVPVGLPVTCPLRGRLAVVAGAVRRSLVAERAPSRFPGGCSLEATGAGNGGTGM